MSTADIFGEADSSDESEAEKDKETTPKDVEMKEAGDDKKEEAEKKKSESNPFGSDDSDDDDDDKPAKETKEDDKKETATEENDPFAEDDSDDSDGDAKMKDKKKDDLEDSDEEVGQKSPAKDAAKKDKSADLGLEDSDDDDDVEFDDTGAVTGSSHNKGFQKKVSRKSALDTLREAEEAEEAAARADVAPTSPKKPAPPKVDPKTMVVLQPERPSSSTSLHVTKLPNLVGIQPEAFDPSTYSAAAEEKEYKGFVNDMVRWRYKKDKNGEMLRDDEGNLLRESNTRLVQWEDGSFTLHIGKEALNMDNIDSSHTVGTVDVVTGRTATFAGLNGYLYLSQMANFREPKKEGEEKDEESEEKDGFIETAAGTVLECMGPMGSRFSARPSSLKSEAHKSLTVAVRKRTIKRAQIAEVVTQFDPEKVKEERIKQKDGLAKEQARKRNYGDNYRSRSRPRVGMNRSYLEDDGDFDSTDLRAIKKRTMNADDEEYDDYGDEFVDYGDDDEDDETFNQKRPRKRAKNRLQDSDDEDDDEPAAATGKAAEDDDDDDDDEDDEVITPVKSSKKKKQAVFDDDSD